MDATMAFCRVRVLLFAVFLSLLLEGSSAAAALGRRSLISSAPFRMQLETCATLMGAGDGSLLETNIRGADGDPVLLGTSVLYAPHSTLAFLPTHIWPGPRSVINWEHVSVEVPCHVFQAYKEALDAAAGADQGGQLTSGLGTVGQLITLPGGGVANISMLTGSSFLVNEYKAAPSAPFQFILRDALYSCSPRHPNATYTNLLTSPQHISRAWESYAMLPPGVSATIKIPAERSLILNESAGAASPARWPFPAEGIPLLPGLGPFTMQAPEPQPITAPFIDFSHRLSAWRLGWGVNISLSVMSLLGMCSKAVGSGSSPGDAPSPPPPSQPAVPTAWPDQLLQAAGLPLQGRTLALAAPLWAMASAPEVGSQAALALGPAANATWYTALGKQERDVMASVPPGKVTVGQAVMVVPTAELLLIHYLSAWTHAMPSLVTAANSSTAVDAAVSSYGNQLPASTYGSLRPLMDAMLARGQGSGAASASAFKAYSLAPRVVHVDAWAPTLSGNTIEGSLVAAYQPAAGPPGPGGPGVELPVWLPVSRRPPSQGPFPCTGPGAGPGLRWPDTAVHGLRSPSSSPGGQQQSGGSSGSASVWVPPIVLVSSRGGGAPVGDQPTGTLGDALATISAWQRQAHAAQAGAGNASAPLLPPTVLLFNDRNSQPHLLARQSSLGQQGPLLQLSGPILITGPVQQQPPGYLNMYADSWAPYRGMPVVNASRSSTVTGQGFALVCGPLLLRNLMLVDLPLNVLKRTPPSNSNSTQQQGGSSAPNASDVRFADAPVPALPIGVEVGAVSGPRCTGDTPWAIMEQVVIELGNQDFGVPLALSMVPRNTSIEAIVAAAAAVGLPRLIRRIPSSTPLASQLAALQAFVRSLQQPFAAQAHNLDLVLLPQNSSSAPTVCQQSGRVCVYAARMEAASWRGSNVVLASKRLPPSELAAEAPWWRGQNLTALSELAGHMVRGELWFAKDLEGAAGLEEAGPEEESPSGGDKSKTLALAAGLAVGLGVGLLALLLGGYLLLRRRLASAGAGAAAAAAPTGAGKGQASNAVSSASTSSSQQPPALGDVTGVSGAGSSPSRPSSMNQHKALAKNSSHNCSDFTLESSPPGSSQPLSQPDEDLRQALLAMKEQGLANDALVLEDVLGGGGYGVVFKGKWRGLDVAVKRMLIQQAPGPVAESMRKQAMHEFVLAKALVHPNIVSTYSYELQQLHSKTQLPTGVSDWHLYIVQEYCDSGTLAKAISNRRFHTPDAFFDCLCLAVNVAAGMKYLHEKNIIHGDLKPDNILLTSKPELPHGFLGKVCDFGLSRMLQTEGQSHLSGVRGGTPLYIAPEVLREGRLSKAADLYAFGVILWELYHGTFAFDWVVAKRGPMKQAELYAIQMWDGYLTFPYGCASPRLQQLILGCTSPDPHKRPSFEDAIHELCACIGALLEVRKSEGGAQGSPTRLQERLHMQEQGRGQQQQQQQEEEGSESTQQQQAQDQLGVVQQEGQAELGGAGAEKPFDGARLHLFSGSAAELCAGWGFSLAGADAPSPQLQSEMMQQLQLMCTGESCATRAPDAHAASPSFPSGIVAL